MKTIIALLVSTALSLQSQVAVLLSTNGLALLTVATVETTPPGTVTYQTNCPSGQWITNNSGHVIDVSCSVTNISALVSGFCGMELWVGYTTNLSGLKRLSATT